MCCCEHWITLTMKTIIDGLLKGAAIAMFAVFDGTLLWVACKVGFDSILSWGQSWLICVTVTHLYVSLLKTAELFKEQKQ